MKQENRCNCTTLRKASRRLSQLYDAAIAESGLKTTQRAILSEIGRAGAINVGRLATALVMDPGALAHTLKPLARDGLIAISVDSNDRRNRLVTLTPTGSARLAASDALWEQAQRAFEAAFGKANAKALRQSMRRLISDAFADDVARRMRGAQT